MDLELVSTQRLEDELKRRNAPYRAPMNVEVGVPLMMEQVARFHKEVLGTDIPASPKRLSPEQKAMTVTYLKEELQEFIDADTFEDEVDALLDGIYFALGAILKQGVTPGPAFTEVHYANMKKHLGTKANRPQFAGQDAEKPATWSPPNLMPFLSVTRDQVLNAYLMSADQHVRLKAITPINMLGVTYGKSGDPRDHVLPDNAHGQAVCIDGVKRMPKLLVLGYGRHGKDTVGELLRDEYGMRFTSSSAFCAEHVITPLLVSHSPETQSLMASFDNEEKHDHIDGCLREMRLKGYTSAEQCFHDRGNFRDVWYEAIRHYNTPDPSRLAREILKDNDVYCGIRSRAELNACKNRGVFDHVIWVDRLDHLPPEPRTSCDVEPWMADYVIDNNGSLDDLIHNVGALMDRLLQPYARN